MVATVAVVMVEAILSLKLLIQTNRQERKVGKIEVMVIRLKILNMKVVGAGEKGEFQMRAIYPMKIINIPFPLGWKLS